MAKWALVGMLLVACGSKVDDKPSKTPGITRVPSVTVASVVIAAPKNPPPVIILLDASNQLRASRSATWDLLSTKDPLVGSVATTLSDASGIIWEGRALDQTPGKIFETFKKAATEKGTISEDTRRPIDDDPPPPEEEDKPDDGEDESGGQGTPNYLEEPKFRTKQEPEDPRVAAEQAKEAARKASREMLHQVTGPRVADTEPSSKSPYLASLASTVTEWMQPEELEDPPLALLLAAPNVKASDFIAVVRQLRPLVAVNHGGKLRPLRLETVPEERSGWYSSQSSWIELTLGPNDMQFEAVPETPVTLMGAFEQAAFTDALARARETRGLEPLTRVDVLVDRDISVQRLIDVLVALDQAGVVMIGLGERPENDSPAKALRGRRRPEMSLGQPNAQGDLDKAIIRRYMKRNRDKILACYELGLRRNISLSGTVVTQFFITPNGNVASSAASGVDPEVANCVANVIKAIEFPKPKGGGGVQVAYPFTFRF